MKTKYFVGASIFIFWVVVTAVTTAVIVLNEKNKQTNDFVATSTQTDASFALTTTEIAKHNSPTSCWMIIHGTVYDLTSFFGSHPGGDRALQSSCGTDASAAFDTRGGTGSHSQAAQAMLARYSLGVLGTAGNGSGKQGGIQGLPSLPVSREVEEDD